ncbi:transketolase [Gregarina niphandrodes]|uniref:transketolase n=1 Tax=Gregarina niphandrodes TaxID=110365 RepID=A0A023B0T7_GRENI|nr:transketolase [Gregarina niphandrodes]EZG45897.1 transketolase [Gregarina niphandrodes]|eukprot:XP_011132423.1 transketolase [Gregarina niphandrodes]
MVSATTEQMSEPQNERTLPASMKRRLSLDEASNPAMGGTPQSVPKYVKREEGVFRDCLGFVPEDGAVVNYIRCLTASIVSRANSGHPGAPMGCAVMAHGLFGYVMNANGEHPDWVNRDRFVLSNGHACALLYTMLHLTGHAVSMEDLKSFRKLGSICAGHPEVGLTSGVEVTTGPLGQGIANAVGLALGTRLMAARFSAELFNNYTYAILGDGCLQEGVSAEACSLAGTWKLGSLIALYDRNGITIDGSTELSFTDDTANKFRAWNWQVLYLPDGDRDLSNLVSLIEQAKKNTQQPTLIIVDTTIGYGSLKQGSCKVHGAPLSKEDMKQLCEKSGFVYDDIFEVPESVKQFYQAKKASSNKAYAEWMDKFNQWKQNNPVDAAELERRLSGNVCDRAIEQLNNVEIKEDAPRNVSQACLQAIAAAMPELVGGSADLMESNKTDVVSQVGGRQCPENAGGRYLHFGVREHGMAAIINGLAGYGGFKVFNSTFLNFYTYAWGAARLAALSHFPVLMLATHDSIELGEDGPTHQPVEVPALLRATPNLDMIRPGDAREVVGAYRCWMKSTKTPVVLALARGKVPVQDKTDSEKVAMGAYVLRDFAADETKPKLILAASGSELFMADKTAELLSGYNIRTVSMPSWDLFEKQTAEYRRDIFPRGVPAAIMEPYSSYGIDRYFYPEISVSLDRFGVSAPVKDARQHLGYTPEAWAEKIKQNYKQVNSS